MAAFIKTRFTTYNMNLKNIYLFFLSFYIVSCNFQDDRESIGAIGFIKISELEKVSFDNFLSFGGHQLNLEAGSNIFLSDDLRLTFTEQDIFILDYTQSRLFRFSEYGNYINEIGTRGKGPDEYLSISNFLRRGNSISLISNVGMDTKLYNYSIDGELLTIETVKNFVICDMEEYNKSLLIAYTDFNKFIHQHRLYYLDSSFHVVEKKLDNRYKADVLTVDEKKFFRWKDEVFLKESFKPYIYKVSENGIEIKYVFDFGAYAVGDVFWNTEGVEGMEQLFMKGFSNIRNFFQNDRFAFFLIVTQKKGTPSIINYIIHDKMTNRYKKVEFKEPLNIFDYKNPVGITEKDEIIFIGYPKLIDAPDLGDLNNPVLRYFNIIF